MQKKEVNAMALDIGIDLGTSTILASDAERKVVIKEPSVVAVDTRTRKVLDIGENVYHMIGRTPDKIQVVRPLKDGVIADYAMTEALIRHLMQRISNNRLIKPRVIVCIPSITTGVEAQSVIDATVAAGTRQVYLIEEPVAAALGAGIDITKPNGNMVVDIGGGTADIAVLSLGGVVCKASIKTAGQAFDAAIIKYMRGQYNLLIGEKTAEDIKMGIGSVYLGGENPTMEAKGRNLLTGLPTKVTVSQQELYPYLHEVALQIVKEVQGVMEKTPPELVADIRDNGLVMTGGGALLGGLDELLEERITVRARLADNVVECVSLGTIKGFDYLGTLFDGFIRSSTHSH